MSKKVLVAYATKCDSTIEVAQEIGDTISQNGVTVNVKPIKEISDISDYDAAIVGSAIRMAQWLPEATAFIKKYQSQLNKKPTAIFSVHILNLDDNPESQQERLAYTNSVKKILTPKAEAFFAGKIDQAQLSFFERLLFRMIKSPEGDFRNWEAIRNWAAEVTEQM
jgi:menaquinone-dependent protoporphyrinogen oxidase